MKASGASLLDFLSKSSQFVIPIYQRTYSWMERECSQLWDDILRTGSNDNISGHFIGSIVYIEKGISQVINRSPLLVIDGQQRLTTISLILEALARRIGNSEPIDGFSAPKIREYYLINRLEQGDRKFKLLLTQTDKSSLIALLDQKPLPKDHSIRIKDNFEFFSKKIMSLGENLALLCKGLAKLVIVDIALDRSQDNPQLIFESMNSTGKELSQADLIRNFVLMGLEPEPQTKLYEEHWRPMETEFGQDLYDSQFDRFMRHYLTIKTGDIPNIDRVYESFKQHATSEPITEMRIFDLIADIHTFAEYYCCMVLTKEENKDLAEAFQDLREVKVEVAYPFLLELYHDFRNNRLSASDFLLAVRLVESYVFRRAICSIPTNSLNNTFADFGRALDKEHYLESIQAHFINLPSYRRFPDDEEFKRELMIRDLYNFPRRSYWLRRMENFDRKERVSVTEYTIEHILPQNESLSTAWQNALGPDWQRVRDTWLHTLGNLTLTGYNSELSDHSFIEKRDIKGGFRESPLRLNQGLGDLDTWNEVTIQNRAEKLASVALNIWKAPELSPEILEKYRQKVERPATYTIDNHPHLAPDKPMRPIFDAFRKEVLALNPVVIEEFLKLYVSYKAETNFVDVEAQAKRLRLTLNMKYHEVDDPRELCRNVKGKGKWGNGEVEVGLKSLEDLPYVLGLVRQALEKQMGNGENE